MAADDASGAHRPIELQTPDDLAYLVANVRRAAAARLDEAFPPLAGGGAAEGTAGEDELRTRIEELVDEYIARTFSLAGPNLSINGLPVEDISPFLSGDGGGGGGAWSTDPLRPDEVYEPFDARKRARVEELAREEEDLLRDIAHLKKSVPAAAAAAWADAARRGVADDEAALAAANARAAGAYAAHPAPAAEGEPRPQAPEPAPASLLGVEALALDPDRRADAERAYRDAVRGLGRLKREMPSVVARMERARGAGEYVITER
ncbi:hypothetical protein GGS23DRAFT_620476 [Durotheca rogersii]|uniref:uncharacterized protein n=1 Tax=Durotheca rogersii TaxID=419775 RepID=UPI00221EA07D|nr:uncharacterized protein GGS23DRAFT_620476 [Durotheca rogersii]KAI5863682.1 hypothetical protein GGS23DRAFT_620476 [Durotheca rogersii]